MMHILLLSWITLIGCSEDPVLEAARQQSAASGSQEEAAPSAAAPQGGSTHPIDGGQASAPAPVEGELKPGIPEEPEPGKPDQPPPGDEAPEHKPGIPEEPVPGSPEQPPPGDEGADHPIGIPDEPEPGKPDQPSPGGGAARQPPPVEGPTVTVRGRVQMRDYRQGNLRIDIFDGDQLQFSGPRPSVVSVITMDQPGTFEVQLPVSAGRVWISCFNDENGDGRPSPMDPVGYFEGNPLSVKGGDVGDVLLELKRRDPPQGGLDEGL